MTLIQSCLPSSLDAGLSSVSDCGQQRFLCVWIPGDRTRHEHAGCDEHCQKGHHKSKNDDSCSLNFLTPSTENNMSEHPMHNIVYKRRKIERNFAADAPLPRSSTPTCVYKRRKIRRNPAAVFPVHVSVDTAIDNCISANSSEAVSVAVKEHMVTLPNIDNHALQADSDKLDLASKSGFVDGSSVDYKLTIEEELHKSLDFCAVNDNCSSSKSNMDIGSASLKLQVDDVGECSSSGALVVEGLGNDISRKNAYISFVRRHKRFEGSLPTTRHQSEKQTSVKKNISCLRSCKVCDQSETAPNMLICDLCGESFHLSCCSPPVKKLPIDDWFCRSCLRKKLKKLKEISPGISSKNDSGPIALMLRDGDPYTTHVRIGKDFQVEVPDWSGPLTGGLTDYGKPVGMSQLECASSQGCNSSKLSRFSSIGNWLQCRAVIDDDGTICGKWRRAPLFEVQTDNWECFGSVLWDPSHADCAVPQELDTDQVLKHLKYVEMLRPRLSAKRCKLRENWQQEDTRTS